MADGCSGSIGRWPLTRYNSGQQYLDGDESLPPQQAESYRQQAVLKQVKAVKQGKADVQQSF